MENGDKRFVAAWYGPDAIDEETGDFIPDAIKYETFDTYLEAVSKAKEGAFKSGVAEWCQVIEELCVSARFNQWEFAQTTTFSRNNNRWSVDEIEQAS